MGFRSVTNFVRTLAAVGAASSARGIDLVAAGVAFYALFALFPAMAAVVAIFGYFANPAVIESALELYGELLPPEALDLIQTQLAVLMQTHETTLGWASVIALAVAVWATRLGVAGLTVGLTTIYGLPARNGFMFYIHALILTVAMVSVAAIALGMLVILPFALAFFPLGGLFAMVMEISRWAVALLVVFVGLWIFYRFGPNRKRLGRDKARTWPGLLLAVVLWLAASVGLNLYLAHFSDFDAVYGPIGAVLILMLWVYASAYSILLGGVLNAVLEERDYRGAGMPRPSPSA